jgi:hypothetical protein
MIRLSDHEQIVLKLIPSNGKKITTRVLVVKFYEYLGTKVPMHGRVNVGSKIRSLIKKTRLNDVRVRSSKRAGPYPIDVWKERRE